VLCRNPDTAGKERAVTIATLQAHDDLQARIWADERHLPPGTREAALAIAWVLFREPEHAPGRDLWRRVRDLLGHQGVAYAAGDGTARACWRMHELIAADAPRYERGRWRAGQGACEGPRLRPYRPRRVAAPARCLVSDHHPHLGDCRYPEVYGDGAEPPPRDDRLCGTDGVIEVVEYDMVTGWETAHWFCRRHAGRAAEVRVQLAAGGEPPEPIPNTGGLLPRYFATDWPEVYRKYCDRARGSLAPVAWEPPYYGCDADQWPVPGRDPVPRRPRLAVIGS
jgi:hypothetical protein